MKQKFSPWLWIIIVTGFCSYFYFFFINDSTRSTINLVLDHHATNLDPAQSYSDDELTIAAQVMEPLYQYHYLKRPYELVPLLAEAMPEFFDNGKRMVIKIKRGIKYHPHQCLNKNRTVKSDDFVLAIKRLAVTNLESPFLAFFKDTVLGFNEFSKEIGSDYTKLMQKNLPGLQAIDESTLEIKLNSAEPNFLYYMAMNVFSPVPKELVECSKNFLGDKMIGTGPYTYKGYINKQFYELEKFEEFREEFYPSVGDRYANTQKLVHSSKERIPFVKHVRFYVFDDDEVRWKSFLDGEIDAMTVPKTHLKEVVDPTSKIQQFFKEESIEIKQFPLLATRWLAFNMRDPFWGKRKQIRLAIAKAIDYDAYLTMLSQKTNLRANSILPPGIFGYHPSKPFPFETDVDEAKDILKKEGFPDGKGLPALTYSTRGNQEIQLREADFLKKQLLAIGIELKVEVLPFNDFLKKGRAGHLQFFTDNWWFDYPDAENIVQLLVKSNSPGINKSGYMNDRVESLYQELKQPLTQDEILNNITEVENIVLSDVAWIPLMYESAFVIQRNSLLNFRKSSVVRNYVKYLSLSHEEGQ